MNYECVVGVRQSTLVQLVEFKVGELVSAVINESTPR